MITGSALTPLRESVTALPAYLQQEGGASSRLAREPLRPKGLGLWDIRRLLSCIIPEGVVFFIKSLVSEENCGSLENLWGHHSGRRRWTRAQLLDPRYR